MSSTAMNKFFDMFKKKPKKIVSIKEQLSKADIGNTVRLKFRDPKKAGFIDPTGSLSLRFDADDLETRQITGTILLKKNLDGLIIIEIGCFKMSNGQRRERVYTLMAEEIETIEVV